MFCVEIISVVVVECIVIWWKVIVSYYKVVYWLCRSDGKRGIVM